MNGKISSMGAQILAIMAFLGLLTVGSLILSGGLVAFAMATVVMTVIEIVTLTVVSLSILV